MILKAKHNFIIYPFFKQYALWIIKKSFSNIRVIGQYKAENCPVLLIANHISWWDGFWAMYLNLKLLNRRFHFMMLEDQLRKFWFFTYTGGYSVNKKAKSLIETLNYTSELLQDPKNMVLVFPQGEIHSMHLQTIQFEKGIEYILKHSKVRIQILFMANMVDYFSLRKPGVNLYIETYTGLTQDIDIIQKQYQDFYQRSLDYQKSLTV